MINANIFIHFIMYFYKYSTQLIFIIIIIEITIIYL